MKTIKYFPKEGIAYSYIHFAVEVMCFYYVTRIYGSSSMMFAVALFYDTFAFAPQALIGAFCDRFNKFHAGLIGAVLMFVAATAGLIFGRSEMIWLIILALGNSFVHVSGALTTLTSARGRMSNSSIFVGGGAFGVITGKLLAVSDKACAGVFVIMIVAVVLMIATDHKQLTEKNYHRSFSQINTASDAPEGLIVVLLIVLVSVRAYMGYGLPTAWNTSVKSSVVLFICMGIGKMAGGIVADLIGAKKTAIISIVCALPFLIVGNHHMYISIIGVVLFSMTMAVTLGGLSSVLYKEPGLAFGLTTIGLLLGTLPVIFWGTPRGIINIIVLVVLTIISATASIISLKNNIIKQEV